ncbi:MAG: restriction endonuclease subunit S [Rivularia sp. (in: cyanobacteria)]
MSKDRDDLPPNWSIEKIEEICTFNPKHDRSFSDDLEISFVPMSTVDEQTGTIKKHDSKLLGKVRKGYTHFADDDIIFAKITPCMENGKSAVARNLINGLACGSTEFHVLRNNGGVLPDYLLNFVRQASYLSIAAGQMTGVVGQRRLPKEFLLTTKIPLPPLNEQKRIVGKIEALQKRSQRVKEASDAIPQLLDQFRQSVLAAAFRGDLTADWRENNPDVEPASVLLEKIRAERRRKWEEAELEKMKVKGKVPKDDKWKQKYKEPEAVDDFELPELPDGWGWASFAQVSDRVTVGHVGSMKDEYRKQGIPFLRSQNVRENRFEAEGITFISRDFHEKLSKSSLQPGDLVVVRSGGVGVSCVIPETLQEANCSDLVIVKQPRAIISEYGAFYMNSIAKSHVNSKQVGVALIHFNTKSMAEMLIPVPSLEEQKILINKVNNFFKIVENIEQQYQETKANLDLLNQSILAKAFRGELVPQNPNDEPASILLERIRAEREKLQQQTKAAKKSKSKTTKRRSKKAPQQVEEPIQLELPGMEEEG